MNTHKVTKNAAQLRALTTLDPDEFDRLLKPFKREFRRHRKMYKIKGKRRRTPLSSKRLENPTKYLPTGRDRLLFILLALKTDAIQQHLAATFEMKQTTVSQWYNFLLPVLDKALKKLGCKPARNLDELVAALRESEDKDPFSKHKNGPDDTKADASLHMDVTGRQIPRNTDSEAQKNDYSGKFSHHAVKNTIICDDHQRIVYLGPTWRGAIHDKRMADEELPDLGLLGKYDLWLTLDSGYLGYVPEGVNVLESQRARRGHPLEKWQIEMNKWVGSVRIIVEHAIGAIKRMNKASRIRTFKRERADVIMQIAAGLHNLRVACRKSTYQNSYARTRARLKPFG